MRHGVVMVVVSVCIGGCAGSRAPTVDLWSRNDLHALRAEGLSGTATDADGRLWAIPESRNYLYRFDDPFGRSPRGWKVPLVQRPAGVEIESIAWLRRDALLLGTEMERTRDADRIFLARVDGGSARIVGWFVLPWNRLWGISAPANEGIEALCASGDVVVAGGEPTRHEGGGVRWAPLALTRFDGLRVGPWVARRLRLTTSAGKLASLDCIAERDGEIQVYAIERHYGVTRVLRFDLPADDARGGEIIPEVVVDLGHLDHLPNMEGVSLHGARLLIVTDHDSPAEAGTTQTLVLGPLDDD